MLGFGQQQRMHSGRGFHFWNGVVLRRAVMDGVKPSAHELGSGFHPWLQAQLCRTPDFQAALPADQPYPLPDFPALPQAVAQGTAAMSPEQGFSPPSGSGTGQPPLPFTPCQDRQASCLRAPRAPLPVGSAPAATQLPPPDARDHA
jgi:hypothetical protein